MDKLELIKKYKEIYNEFYDDRQIGEGSFRGSDLEVLDMLEMLLDDLESLNEHEKEIK